MSKLPPFTIFHINSVFVHGLYNTKVEMRFLFFQCTLTLFYLDHPSTSYPELSIIHKYSSKKQYFCTSSNLYNFSPCCSFYQSFLPSLFSQMSTSSYYNFLHVAKRLYNLIFKLLFVYILNIGLVFGISPRTYYINCGSMNSFSFILVENLKN